MGRMFHRVRVHNQNQLLVKWPQLKKIIGCRISFLLLYSEHPRKYLGTPPRHYRSLHPPCCQTLIGMCTVSHDDNMHSTYPSFVWTFHLTYFYAGRLGCLWHLLVGCDFSCKAALVVEKDIFAVNIFAK